MSDNDAATLMRSIIASDEDISNEAIDRLGGQRTQALLVCGLAVALDRQFPDGSGADDVSRYVADLSSRYPHSEDEIKPAIAEALIRTMRGEENLLDGISGDDIVPLEFLLLHDIMSRQDLSESELNEYVKEVTTLVDAHSP